MPDPVPPSRRDQTYTEEMQLWLARQSFWYRLRHFRRHPDARPLIHAFLRLVAFAIPVLAVLAFGFYVLINRYTSSTKFTRLMEQEAGEFLGLADASMSQAQWKAGAITLVGLSGEGKPESWIRSFKFDSVRFESSFRELFAKDWAPEDITIQGMNLELRGGMLGADEGSRLAKEQSEKAAIRQAERTKKGEPSGPFTGQLGMNPSSERFSCKHFLARDSTVSWGLNEFNSGKLANSTIEATRKDGGLWHVRCTGGLFSLGWLKDARVGELILEADKESLRITKFDFQLPQAEGKQGEAGSGQGEGKITLGAKPEIELTLNLQGLEINRVLPPDYQRVFAGTVQGKALVKGNTSDETGFTTQFALTLREGFGFGVESVELFPVLDVLGGEAADLQVRYMAAARGGINLVLANKTLKAEGVNLETADGERIEGFFTFETTSRNITGVFRVGLKPQALSKHARVKEAFFREETAGLVWITLPLEGALATSTVSIADGLRAALKREIEDEKIQR